MNFLPPCQPPSVFCIAEMSANHDRSLERAQAIMRAAADADADAIKLQTYTADSMTLDCQAPCFMAKGDLWVGRSLYDVYTEAAMPWEWVPGLMAMARDLGMECFSTPFDAASVDFLEHCGVTRYKIASFELVDIPLLQRVGGTGKPVLLSTGMASLAEIDEAVRTLRGVGAGDITLLKCTSAYPAPPEEANLRTLPHMAQTFRCDVGISDHTAGSAVAVAAVALGAVAIEKHFTLDRKGGGPDDTFSMEPSEFAEMVRNVRVTSTALGEICYELTDAQRRSVGSRRSLFVVRDIKAGEVINMDTVRSIRPGLGLHTRHLPDVLGRKAAQDIARGTPLTWNLLS